VDSSRYFAIRISEKGRPNLVVGLGFQDRNEAFDFKVAIQDFQNRDKVKDKTKGWVGNDDGQIRDGFEAFNISGGSSASNANEKDNEEDEGSSASSATAGGHLDLSLPQSGMIHVNLKGAAGHKKENEGKSTGAISLSAPGGPSTEKEKKKKKKKDHQAADGGATGETPDDWVKF